MKKPKLDVMGPNFNQELNIAERHDASIDDCSPEEWDAAAARFQQRRFSPFFHLGGGDIRLTMADQDCIARRMEMAQAFAKKLLDKITVNNIKVVQECMSWQCSERDHGGRCPNCPREFEIDV